mmetsp:Transcript_5266/g.15937  ORF Transcript_5266/g.15937 Transcript_5266/m.15937 type:complete len:204 (+) Transcript_5266:1923-2534(+)
MRHHGRNGRGRRGEAHEAVEASDHLRQLSDFDGSSNCGASGSAGRHKARRLCQHRGAGTRGLHAHQRRRDAAGDADDAERGAGAGRRLVRQAPDRRDAQRGRHQVDAARHQRERRRRTALGVRERADQRDRGQCVQIVVLLGVVGALEQVEHAPCDGEASADVDRRHEDRRRRERVHRRLGQQAAAAEHHASNDGQAGDGVGD